MTKSDKPKKDRGPRFTVQYSDEMIRMVEEERVKRGYNTSSPIYQEALKFYFENKDKRIFMSQDELDAYEDNRLEALLTDKKRLVALKRILNSLDI